jgi:hypothetical protein
MTKLELLRRRKCTASCTKYRHPIYRLFLDEKYAHFCRPYPLPSTGYTAVIVQNERTLEKIYHLRSQMYCDELKWVEPDEFDLAATLFAAQMCYYHHEKWDGSGYPEGLARQEIPLAARIIALTDVYDVLRSTRPYKPAYSHTKACTTLLNGRGTHFDPDAVDAFI